VNAMRMPVCDDFNALHPRRVSDQGPLSGEIFTEFTSKVMEVICKNLELETLFFTQ